MQHQATLYSVYLRVAADAADAAVTAVTACARAGIACTTTGGGGTFAGMVGRSTGFSPLVFSTGLARVVASNFALVLAVGRTAVFHL